jgi:hypothetical protein
MPEELGGWRRGCGGPPEEVVIVGFDMSGVGAELTILKWK